MSGKIDVSFTHVGEHLTVDLQQPRVDVSVRGSEPLVVNGSGPAHAVPVPPATTTTTTA